MSHTSARLHVGTMLLCLAVVPTCRLVCQDTVPSGFGTLRRDDVVIRLATSSTEIQVLPLERADVMLLCTDGLTKHVSDEEIRDQVMRPDSASAICQALIELALSRGGEDNVTVVMGKARQP